MTAALQHLLAELEQFGETNDRTHAERPRRMLNITRDTGQFLGVLVRAIQARQVLEIGTSNGYSTLWLAEAAQATGGAVITVDHDAFKVGLAARTFARSGLAPCITQQQGEAGAFLAAAPAESADLIFLDSERTEYPDWWPDLKRILRRGGLLVVDNATSHAEQMAPLIALVEADPDFTTCLVPVGKGEYLATRSTA